MKTLQIENIQYRYIIIVAGSSLSKDLISNLIYTALEELAFLDINDIYIHLFLY